MSSQDDDVATENPFRSKEVFPDAAAVFSFRPRPLGEVKDECVVVLDTNVLLVPYTTSPKTLQEISKTYERLARRHRLIVPAHVAREFARNRAKKLGELYQQLSSRQSGIKPLQSGRYPLLESVSEYASVTKLEKDIDGQLTAYKEALGSVLKRIREWNWDDPVSLLYSKLFDDSVVVEAKIATDELQDDFKDRCESKMPPGYKDAGKDLNAAGDLIIWHTILEIGESLERPVIFVSGDGKPDWWHKSAGQPLYPRYELVDEFRRRSRGQSFYITKFSDFLDLFGLQEAVVAEVRQREISFTSRDLKRYTSDRIGAGIEAIAPWLLSQYPGSRVVREESRTTDLLVLLPNGDRVGVEVKIGIPGSPFNLIHRLRDLGYRAFYEMQTGHFSSYLVCIITENYAQAREYERVLQRMVAATPPLTVSIGAIRDGMFWEVSRVQTAGQTATASSEA